jgi:small subunit ribosomal protein S6
VNEYEIVILYDPDLEIDLEKATSRVEKIFTDNGGKIKNTDNWGKRKLAYPIKKNESAVYVIYTMDIPGEGVQKIEKILNITDEVIRFLIVKPDHKAIAKAEAQRAKQASRRSSSDTEESEDSDEKEEK